MSRIRVLLLMMFLLSVSILIEIKPTGAQESSQIASITLNGANPISMPSLCIGPNWTYLYDQVHVLRENQSINGILSGAKDSAVEICIDQLSVTELLKSSPSMKSHNCFGPSVKLNQTDEAGFTLPGTKSGIYALSASNTTGSLLTALYLLVCKENLSIALPESIPAGEPLKVKANISLKNHNQSLIFGAIMISADDYRNMRLNLTSKGTGSGYNSTLSLGNRSAQLPEFSHISLDLAMSLLYLLPSNSAVGIQESQQSETEIFMITDETWPKGEYILTYAIYSRQEGLLGIKQQKIMVA